MEQRAGEEPRMWFRADRVFRADGEWFIQTREGIAIGPYPRKAAADMEAEVLQSVLSEAHPAQARDIVIGFMMSEGQDPEERDAMVEQAMFDSAVARLVDDELDAVGPEHCGGPECFGSPGQIGRLESIGGHAV
jgi:hypothetical protein